MEINETKQAERNLKAIEFEKAGEIEKAIAKYLEPGLYFTYNRKEVLERTKRGKLKQFQSML